jgi:hypothetical protein
MTTHGHDHKHDQKHDKDPRHSDVPGTPYTPPEGHEDRNPAPGEPGYPAQRPDLDPSQEDRDRSRQPQPGQHQPNQPGQHQPNRPQR